MKKLPPVAAVYDRRVATATILKSVILSKRGLSSRRRRTSNYSVFPSVTLSERSGVEGLSKDQFSLE
jgi:hypothetical protein